MKSLTKIINTPKPASVIEVDDIIYNETDRFFIFYYTSNRNYPCFLVENNQKWGFMSPFTKSVTLAFTGHTKIDSIKNAMESRELYMVPKEDWELIFHRKK